MEPRKHAEYAASEFSSRLKAARKLAGMTQDQLAEAAALSPVSLSKFETGVNLPNFESLVSLTRALGISPGYLMGWMTEDFGAQSEQRRATLNRLLLHAEKLPLDWLEKIIGIVELANKK